MTFLVPFDGSPLARAALHRAEQYAEPLGTEIVAVSVVPEDDLYARERDWIDADEPFDAETVAARLREMTVDIASDASFDWTTVETAGAETIAAAIKAIAAEQDVEVVFIGSDNVGQIVTPLSSVGGGVASDAEYDVHIVRHWSPGGPDD